MGSDVGHQKNTHGWPMLFPKDEGELPRKQGLAPSKLASKFHMDKEGKRKGEPYGSDAWRNPSNTFFPQQPMPTMIDGRPNIILCTHFLLQFSSIVIQHHQVFFGKSLGIIFVMIFYTSFRKFTYPNRDFTQDQFYDYGLHLINYILQNWGSSLSDIAGMLLSARKQNYTRFRWLAESESK